jgi:hypothetical protein
MKKLCGGHLNRSKGTNETGRGGFQTRPYRVAQGDRGKRAKHHDTQESMSFPSGFCPHSGPTQVWRGGSGENDCLAEELRPSFPTLGGRMGIRTHKEELDGSNPQIPETRDSAFHSSK